MTCLYRLLRLVAVELHAVELAQQIVRELDVGLVDLVDQYHRRGLGIEGPPQHALDDVVGDVAHPVVTQLRVAQPRDRVVFVEPCWALVVDLMCHWISGRPSAPGHLLRQHGLAGAGLALDEQGRCSCIDALTASIRSGVAT